MIGRFLRNASFISLASFVARARGLIVLPVLSRYLGSADLGVMSQIVVVAATIVPLVVLGSDSGVMRLLSGLESGDQARRYTGWLLYVAGGALAASLVMAAMPHWIALVFFADGARFARFIPLVGATLCATLATNCARRWFQLRNDGRSMAASLVLQAVLSIGAILLAVLLRLGVFGIVAMSAAAEFAGGLGMIAVIAKDHGMGRPRFETIRPAIRFGLPLVPAAYALWGLNWLDRIFLVHYRSFAEIGVYTVAYSLGYAVIEIFCNPVWAMYPSLATSLHNRGDDDAAQRLLHATGGTMIAIVAPAIVGMWALGRPIVDLIAGPQYEDGALVMPIVALGYFLFMLSSFTDLALGFVYRQALATVSIVIACGLNVLLNFLLIPSFGIVGAALATLAAFALHFSLSWCFAVRYAPVWRHFRYPATIIAASLLMGMCIRMLEPVVTGTAIWRLCLLVPVGVGLYLAFCVLLGALQPALRIPLQSRITAYLGLGPR